MAIIMRHVDAAFLLVFITHFPTAHSNLEPPWTRRQFTGTLVARSALVISCISHRTSSPATLLSDGDPVSNLRSDCCHVSRRFIAHAVAATLSNRPAQDSGQAVGVDCQALVRSKTAERSRLEDAPKPLSFPDVYWRWPDESPLTFVRHGVW